MKNCFDSDCRSWSVNDTFTGVKAPMPKHFKRKTWKDGNSPVELLREQLSDLEIVWDGQWGLERLQNELKGVKDFLRRKNEADKRRAEEIKNRER